jgi:hypothetical protein
MSKLNSADGAPQLRVKRELVLVFCSADYEIGTLKLVRPIRPGAKLTVISDRNRIGF